MLCARSYTRATVSSHDCLAIRRSSLRHHHNELRTGIVGACCSHSPTSGADGILFEVHAVGGNVVPKGYVAPIEDRSFGSARPARIGCTWSSPSSSSASGRVTRTSRWGPRMAAARTLNPKP